MKTGRFCGLILSGIGLIMIPLNIVTYYVEECLYYYLLTFPFVIFAGISLIILPGSKHETLKQVIINKNYFDFIIKAPKYHKVIWLIMYALGIISTVFLIIFVHKKII